MVRGASTVVLLLLACERGAPETRAPATEPSAESRATPVDAASRDLGPSPASAAGQTTKRSGDGRCEPEPKEGEPCEKNDSWCVLSWGEPGGHSSALWCRDGRWGREEEQNL